MEGDGQNQFDCYALVELMGHQRIAGRVTEVQVAGAGFLRCDIPDADGETRYSRFYSPGAVYAINPMQREAAILLAQRIDGEPVKAWELPQPEPEPRRALTAVLCDNCRGPLRADDVERGETICDACREDREEPLYRHSATRCERCDQYFESDGDILCIECRDREDVDEDPFPDQ